LDAFTCLIRPFFDRPDVEVPFLFYKVPWTNPADLLTVFPDRFWDDRENYYPPGIGVVPNSLTPYFGPLPSPDVGPLVGDPAWWVQGLSYSAWQVGKYPDAACFPTYGPHEYAMVRIRQKQAVYLRSPLRLRIDQVQGIGVSSPATGSIDQVQGLGVSSPATGSIDQVQGLNPGATGTIDQVQGLGVSSPATGSIDQVQGIGQGAVLSIDQVQGIDQGAVLSIDQVQGIDQGAGSVRIDQVQDISAGTYFKCHGAMGTNLLTLNNYDNRTNLIGKTVTGLCVPAATTVLARAAAVLTLSHNLTCTVPLSSVYLFV
jgi:hypothetical protein